MLRPSRRRASSAVPIALVLASAILALAAYLMMHR
jgi:hypothetical protein